MSGVTLIEQSEAASHAASWLEPEQATVGWSADGISCGTANNRLAATGGWAEADAASKYIVLRAADAPPLFLGGGCSAVSGSTFSNSNCAAALAAVTVINASHGPRLPTVGVIEASPSCPVTTCVCDVPRITGMPFWPAKSPPGGGLPGPCGFRSSVVTNVTFTPITGLSADEPSVTRITSGWKG